MGGHNIQVAAIVFHSEHVISKALLVKKEKPVLCKIACELSP